MTRVDITISKVATVRDKIWKMSFFSGEGKVCDLEMKLTGNLQTVHVP